jgi:hypothetical protein
MYRVHRGRARIAKWNNNAELLVELVAMSSGSYTNVDNKPSEWICKATLVQRELVDQDLDRLIFFR